MLTFVATDRRIGALDAVQYLDGGPCVHAASTGEIVHVEQLDLLDEDLWQLFAQAGAAAGVKSTLSLPILESGRVTGGVNLYGARVGTFRQEADRLAEVFGAWLPGAVTNADLSFSTRLDAMRAPARLEETNTIEAATTVLMETHGVSWEVARRHLRESAARADVSELSGWPSSCFLTGPVPTHDPSHHAATRGLATTPEGSSRPNEREGSV